MADIFDIGDCHYQEDELSKAASILTSFTNGSGSISANISSLELAGSQPLFTSQECTHERSTSAQPAEDDNTFYQNPERPAPDNESIPDSSNEEMPQEHQPSLGAESKRQIETFLDPEVPPSAMCEASCLEYDLWPRRVSSVARHDSSAGIDGDFTPWINTLPEPCERYPTPESQPAQTQSRRSKSPPSSDAGCSALRAQTIPPATNLSHEEESAKVSETSDASPLLGSFLNPIVIDEIEAPLGKPKHRKRPRVHGGDPDEEYRPSKKIRQSSTEAYVGRYRQRKIACHFGDLSKSSRTAEGLGP